MPRDLFQALTDPVISIGTLAEKTGLSVSAIRKYEAEGLLIPHRTPSNHRLFSHEAIERVRIIRSMIQDKGLSVEGIRRLQALLPCWELIDCTSEKRASCLASTDNTRPCWMLRGLDCAPTGNECRSCVVYRLGSQCIQDIKQVLFGGEGSKKLEECKDALAKRFVRSSKRRRR
ncbi:MAG: MerR family transcriptional regulator [Candidatus Riflebacteria bacterium]|nr:MerR family transcriptional regulator [Candidatus Riflebacteria bacterium]